MSVNKIILLGNVGQDPEVTRLETGTTVAKFSLATSEKRKNRDGETVDDTTWHNIVAWKGTAEIVEKYVKKGSTLFIEGKQLNRSYTDRNGNKRYTSEVSVGALTLIGKKNGD